MPEIVLKRRLRFRVERGRVVLALGVVVAGLGVWSIVQGVDSSTAPSVLTIAVDAPKAPSFIAPPEQEPVGAPPPAPGVEVVGSRDAGRSGTTPSAPTAPSGPTGSGTDDASAAALLPEAPVIVEPEQPRPDPSEPHVLARVVDPVVADVADLAENVAPQINPVTRGAQRVISLLLGRVPTRTGLAG